MNTERYGYMIQDENNVGYKFTSWNDSYENMKYNFYYNKIAITSLDKNFILHRRLPKNKYSPELENHLDSLYPEYKVCKNDQIYWIICNYDDFQVKESLNNLTIKLHTSGITYPEYLDEVKKDTLYNVINDDNIFHYITNLL